MVETEHILHTAEFSVVPPVAGPPRVRKNKNFVVLDQQGPFQTTEDVNITAGYSPWIRSLQSDELTKYRSYREQIFSLLGVESMPEIANIHGDQERIDDISQQAYEMLGQMYGIEGDVESVIAGYAETADGVIEHVRSNVLGPYAPNFEMTNEIAATSNPVDLLLVAFDDKYSRQARFEAKRKLELMHLAGTIDHWERNLELEEKYQEFQLFMNEHIWDPSLKIGEVERKFALSEHDPDDFSCTDVRMLDPNEAQTIDIQPGQKLTPFRRRRFLDPKGSPVPVYYSMRKKDDSSRILKLLRKGQENPAVAIEDDLGFMGVFDNEAHIKLFEKHLARGARKAGSMIVAEEVHDSIHGSNGKADNAHSSQDLQMIKYFVRLNGIRVEFILHTNQTYLDYQYRRDSSHGEYNVRRLFDTGVIDLLFPHDIYGVDPEALREPLIERVRNVTESPTTTL